MTLEQHAEKLLAALTGGCTTMGHIGGPECDPNPWTPQYPQGMSYVLILAALRAVAERLHHPSRRKDAMTREDAEKHPQWAGFQKWAWQRAEETFDRRIPSDFRCWEAWLEAYSQGHDDGYEKGKDDYSN